MWFFPLNLNRILEVKITICLPQDQIIISKLSHVYPGTPTISGVIGERKINNALLDLGSSVNLLPYTIYQQLGLGDLKPTRITLQLADQSIKYAREELQDVLVQIDTFVFLVDFVVLDTELVHNTSS